jgi:hypothetical protein
MGAKGIQKNSKKWKTGHGAMVCDIVPRKYTKYGMPRVHMKTLQKKVATKPEFSWLFSEVTMVCASSIAKFGIMVPFLVEMSIFTSPTTFVTSVF